MAWTISYRDSAAREVRRLDRLVQKKIISYLDNVAGLDNPRTRGKGWTQDGINIWRYRVEDYRILCLIEDNELIIHILEIGHRRSIYD